MLTFLATAFALVAPVFGSGSGNPFTQHEMYVQEAYQAEVAIDIKMYPKYASVLEQAQQQPVAYWIDSISRIANLTSVLEGAKNDGNKMVMIVVYDLPDRDCAALASNGEIVCSDSNCADGINKYKTEYVAPIIDILKKYPDLPIVAIVEPDSLPNLATNLGTPKCQQAQTAYKTCVAYSINQLSVMDNVWMYVDAAHGGWLGWTQNQGKFGQVLKEVFAMVNGGTSAIRGFATNTANYQPLGSIDSTADPCNLESQYNFCINEVIYTDKLGTTLQGYGFSADMGWIIDTSRNGVIDERSDCSNWCNIKGAGMGRRPTSDTASITGVNNIDAFVWVKVPGESDGTSDQSSPRYDAHCGSADSVRPMPEAGQWAAGYFLNLTNYAVPAYN